MPKLYFRHGAVSSSKTLNLLSCAHSYRSQNKTVLLMKPAVDDRHGKNHLIKSRSGLEQQADILITNEMNILTGVPHELRADIHCVIVDEAQFLTPAHINQLRIITSEWNVPVIAYGLRTDFKAQLFPGSKRLFEVCDCVEEVKTTCFFCNKKAVFNLKVSQGKPCWDDSIIEVGNDYLPCCCACYRRELLTIGFEFGDDSGDVRAAKMVIEDGKEGKKAPFEEEVTSQESL